MPLNLKETAEERAERAWRKEQRSKRKARSGLSSDGHNRKKRRTEPKPPGEYDYVFDPAEKAWDPSASLRRSPYPEEEDDESRFRGRLFDELAEDSRLDMAEAEYATYLPSRWNRPSANAPPAEMEDEEYAEWVRQGMWARTHAKEAEEEEAKRRAREEKEREKRALREQARREEKEREKKREVKRREKEERTKAEAWAAYERGWTRLAELERIRWEDVPWPTFTHPTGPEELAEESMREFLLSSLHSKGKEKRERQREALLRWHPDKFEGRWMGKVRDREKEKIRDGVGRIVRFLHELAAGTE